MIPRTEIVAVDIDMSSEKDLVALFIETGLSKILVYRDNIDNVLGYIHSSEMFKQAADWKSYIKPILLVPETMTAQKLMKNLMQQKKSIAVVVDEFASFMRISPPNAAYKINSLIRKGYVQKIQSEHDKREYHLQVTQKYKEYYNISNDYVHVVTERMRERFTPDECAKLEEMLTIISKELMPEIRLGSAEA